MEGIPEWIYYLAAGAGVFVSTIVGSKLRNGASEQPASRISGAAIIDSSIGHELVLEVRKLRSATERIAEIMAKRDETERHNAEIGALRREIEALKRNGNRA